MEIDKILVVGAGAMGGGIAQAALEGRCSVRLVDKDENRAAQAVERIRSRLERRLTEGKIQDRESDEMLGHITTVPDLSGCGDAQLVIEAASEKESVKEAIFRQLDPVALPSAIFASNTSAISITRLASLSGRPGKFIGMHFMNPAHVMKLVEVIPGLETTGETVEAIVGLCLKLGKRAVVVADSPGFIANRLLMPAVNQAIHALQEGVASREDIDDVMRLGAGHPMGPLELADFIGLDICLEILETLCLELGETYRPCPLLRKMVAGGRLGKKSGGGFYDYR